jgi:hypothetical protein
MLNGTKIGPLLAQAFDLARYLQVATWLFPVWLRGVRHVFQIVEVDHQNGTFQTCPG